MDAETLDRYGSKYLEVITGRMVAEKAMDTSDAEIERTLRPCVCGDMLVPVAKHLRDSGALQLPYEGEEHPFDDYDEDDYCDCPVIHDETEIGGSCSSCGKWVI